MQMLLAPQPLYALRGQLCRRRPPPPRGALRSKPAWRRPRCRRPRAPQQARVPWWPEPVRPLSRDELQALAADGLVEIGGHTHRHPILAHCTDEAARAEIQQGADRLAEMLGRRARFFAYPNGGAGDFDALRCGPWLEEAGYEAAFSMINGPVQSGQSRWALPRYGAPLSVGEAEATVSGAFEVVRRWRRQFRRQAAL